MYGFEIVVEPLHHRLGKHVTCSGLSTYVWTACVVTEGWSQLDASKFA
jgi:hypothetical protein